MYKKLLLIMIALIPLAMIFAQQPALKDLNKNTDAKSGTITGQHYGHAFIGNIYTGYSVIVGDWDKDNMGKNTLTGIIIDAKAAGLLQDKDILTLSAEIAELNNIGNPNKLKPGLRINLQKEKAVQEIAKTPDPVITEKEMAAEQPEMQIERTPAPEPAIEIVKAKEPEAISEPEAIAEPAISASDVTIPEPDDPTQSGNISGRIVEASTLRGLPSILISVNDRQVLTDVNGDFVVLNTTTGKATLVISAAGFQTKTIEVEISSDTNLGELQFEPTSLASTDNIPEINLSLLDMDDDARSQNISGLLHSSGDVFSSFASFTFGQAWFRTRGYDADFTPTYIGNSLINDSETGRTLWAIWGGLNDATRNSTFVNGLGTASNSFGSIGGVSNIITRPSQQRVQTKLTYSASNRSYTHRVMFTHSTGMMNNGWAVTASGSRRWGQEGYIKGTFYDAWAYYMGLEKKINERHSIELTAFASPVRRGMQGGSTQEIYDMLGTNHYSPNWGYQGGEVRNSRVRTMNQPVLVLNHYWKYNSSTDITTTASYMFGKTGTTALNWYNSADPRPDYYRYLPSWGELIELEPEAIEMTRQLWLNDPQKGQVNWDAMYQANYLAKIDGDPSRYIVEDRRNDMKNINLSTVINHRVNENLKINRGVELSDYTVNYFKTIDDLLGGSHWVDIDQFAERDLKDDTIKQNDLDNPNRVVREGDKFGYDYNLRQQSGKVWISSEFTFRAIDFFLAGQLSSTTFWREGFMRNGRHPENSLGESIKHNFIDYGLKGGATYKFSGRLFLEGRLAYMTQAPYMRNSFVSPRTRDDVSPGLKSEKIFSSELSVHLRAPMVKARATVYHTEFKDQNQILTFYHDDYSTLVNHVMYGINTTHQGLEFGGEAHMFYDLWLQAALNLGNYRYTNRPQATIAFDNGSRADTTELIYLKNFFITGTPQTVGALGLKWVGPNYLFVNLSVNYFDDIYLSFNPERRTQMAIKNLGEGDPKIAIITEQEMLSGGFTVDASIGKSYRIMQKYFLQLNLSANNLLNNKNISTGGYEQLRFDFAEQNVDKYPPRYFYMIGTNFFLNVAVRF
jgi:hypothetical protein